MKKPIYQSLKSLNWQQLSSKSIITLVLLILFSPLLGQSNDPPGFNREKERQEALKIGIQADELESYLEVRRKYAIFLLENKKTGKGTTNTTPSLGFRRKSGGYIPGCDGTFENNGITPWVGWTATNLYGISSFVKDSAIFTADTITGQHTIMDAGNYDPTITTIPVVRTGGGNHSLRLGNSGTGAQAGRISKTVMVTGSCFSFWFALVFQHPDHAYNDQPFFMFRLLDSAGNLLDSFVRGASTNPYFSIQDDIVYRDWTNHTVELGCNYRGKTVTIEFTTADCRQGAHYGYAYLDDICFENCTPCCTSCTDILKDPYYFNTHDLISYTGSTDSSCCYKVEIDPDLFKCELHGIKVYKGNDTTDVATEYYSDSGIWNRAGPGMFTFCIKRSQFSIPITYHVVFYGQNGEVVCEMAKTLQPCHSTSSGCNCNTLFANPNFASTSIIKKDTASSTNYSCCFTLEPFRDSSIIKCPYYGFRVYTDSIAPTNPYMDSFKTGTPIGGAGANMNDTGKMKFCIPKLTFTQHGPQTLRIEYLDSTGKVICSKTEEVNCEESCCENVSYSIIKDSTETDPDNCCYRIEVMTFACSKTHTVELMKHTDSGWVNAGIDTFMFGRPIFFNLCTPNGDTIRYTLFVKDSTGKVICTKQFTQSCPSCCNLINYYTQYFPPPPQSSYDRCCWDIYVFPPSASVCNVWNWKVYDSLHLVPPSYPPFSPQFSNNYQGRFCTDIIVPLHPAPGTYITVNYCIKRYLAVYDKMGKRICLKTIDLCCTRSYSGDIYHPESSVQIAPNPFTETFTMSMNVLKPMPIGVKVLNSMGAVVHDVDYGEQPAGMFTRDINLAGLPAGIYMLSINEGQLSTQIVKE